MRKVLTCARTRREATHKEEGQCRTQNLEPRRSMQREAEARVEAGNAHGPIHAVARARKMGGRRGVRGRGKTKRHHRGPGGGIYRGQKQGRLTGNSKTTGVGNVRRGSGAGRRRDDPSRGTNLARRGEGHEATTSQRADRKGGTAVQVMQGRKLPCRLQARRDAM